MSSEPEVYFKLFANCIPVDGNSRSVICDLQNGQLYFIPNDLFIILSTHNHKNINEIKKIYQNKFDEIIDEYFEYLIQLDVGFFTDTPECYPDLDLQWHYPFVISNAIVDVKTFNKNRLQTIFNELETVHCKHVQVRFWNTVTLSNLQKLIVYIDEAEYIISSIEIVAPYCKDFSIRSLKNFIQECPRITSFVVYESEEKKLEEINLSQGKYIYYTSQKGLNHLACGVIHPSLFSINVQNFTESQNHNSCLNRKVAIDQHGNIKNCPSMLKSYGNIDDGVKLKSVVQQTEFQKLWTLSKNQIDVCKGCEFRYVCTDCRAFLEDPKSIHSKPLKCGYNPNTTQWEDWSTNPLKKKAIEYYHLADFITKS